MLVRESTNKKHRRKKSNHSIFLFVNFACANVKDLLKEEQLKLASSVPLSHYLCRSITGKHSLRLEENRVLPPFPGGKN